MKRVMLWMCGLSMVLVAMTNARAADASALDRFCNGTAQLVYWLAWPTATYQDWEYVGVSRGEHEVDVTVRLEGASGWDGSYLWTDATFVIDMDGSVDLRFGTNNAELVPPGVTTEKAWAYVKVYLRQALADVRTNQ